MYFAIEDNQLSEKNNTVCDKVSFDMKKEFDSKLVYNKEFLKSKIKSHGAKVTDSDDKKFSTTDSNHIFNSN